MSNDVKVINVKLDADTKNKFEILCFMKNKKLQEYCLELIQEIINQNADLIADVDSKRE